MNRNVGVYAINLFRKWFAVRRSARKLLPRFPPWFARSARNPLESVIPFVVPMARACWPGSNVPAEKLRNLMILSAAAAVCSLARRLFRFRN
jgi:hypothetical protein